MTYLVTSTKPTTGSAAGVNTPGLAIFDEEDVAKAEAEKLLKRGCTDVTLWQQVAQPTIEQKVLWSDQQASGVKSV